MGAAVVIFVVALVLYPRQGFDAGISGLKVFWDMVCPSLLPFFILSELMLGLGIVNGFGVLLEPLMRPLFSVPGIGAFALSMGLAAGYPMDAVITARFREDNLCTRIEGERLLAFTNTADPLFMLSAVAVGMFHSPALGGLLAIAHYISSFLVGVSFKFWGVRVGREEAKQRKEMTQKPRLGILRRAYSEMIKARSEDGRPFGKLLGNSVTESVQTLLMICGFIVFFAVFIEILDLSGLMNVLGWPVLLVYHVFGISPNLVHPTLAGLLEIDIGTAQTAAVNAPLIEKVALASGIIAWSGLAVHAQVASVLTDTDIRMAPYFLARLLHGLLAAIITVALWRFGLGQPVGNVVAHIVPVMGAVSSAAAGNPWWVTMRHGVSLWIWFMIGMLAVSFIFALVKRGRSLAWRLR